MKVLGGLKKQCVFSCVCWCVCVVYSMLLYSWVR